MTRTQQVDVAAEEDLAGVGPGLAGDAVHHRRLAGAVGADDADDAAGRQAEAEVFEQQFVAVGLGEVVRFDDGVAESFGDLDEDLGAAEPAVGLFLDEFIERAGAELSRGAKPPRIYRLEGRFGAGCRT